MTPTPYAANPDRSEPPDRLEPGADGWRDGPDADFLPPRSRGRLLRPLTVVLFAASLAGAGFLGGVLIEKHQLPSSSSAAGARSVASTSVRSAGAGGAPSTGGSGGASSTGGSGAVAGQVSTVSGGTLYVTDSSGNTIKVTTSPASQITKTAAASVYSVHPGDTVVIQGVAGANGTIAATAVRDSGTGGSAGGGFAARGSGSSAAGGSSTSTPNSAASSGTVNSLFGG
jgi:hypothetical protein